MRAIAKAVGFIAGCVILGGLGACGSPDAPGTGTPADSSIDIILPGRIIEPAQSMSAEVMLTYGGTRRLVPAERVVWTSSDPTIATVNGGVIVGRQPGSVTIGAVVGRQASAQDLTVQWKPDAVLSVTIPSDTVAVGGRFQARALVRTQRVAATQWTSLNAAVASIDSIGVVTPLAAGRATIRAEFAGLQGATTFDVVVAPSLEHGFGYVYSYDAPALEPYGDSGAWDPPPDQGYSTGTYPRLYLSPPYPTSVEFGWIGQTASVPGALLHVVPFDLGPCAAYLNARQDYIWTSLGTPQSACFDRQYLRSSDHMEFIAMSPTAFTGTLALVRPGMASTMSSGAPIAEVDAAADTRDYSSTGLVRDSLYWFVSPGRPELGNCSVAPAGATPAAVMARVICRTSAGVDVPPVVYAIGFGSDAARDANPREFAELDSLGHVIRASATAGLGIAGTRLASQFSQTYQVSITGERMADFKRLPAVFLTAVSSSAPLCLMNASRVSPTEMVLRVTCASLTDGLLIGVTY